MTIKTEINGLPFEIEVEDGVNLEFKEGKLTVKRGLNLAPAQIHNHYHYSGYPQWTYPNTIYVNPNPTIICNQPSNGIATSGNINATAAFQNQCQSLADLVLKSREPIAINDFGHEYHQIRTNDAN